MSKYHDICGNPVTLYVKCSENPTWAKNHIEALYAENKVMEDALTEIGNEDQFNIYGHIARVARSIVSDIRSDSVSTQQEPERCEVHGHHQTIGVPCEYCEMDKVLDEHLQDPASTQDTQNGGEDTQDSVSTLQEPPTLDEKGHDSDG